MVDALHAAGIEVILDVVFNHSAEAGHMGPTLSFRGLDNPAYYRLEPGDPSRYVDTTGCGNSLNAGDLPGHLPRWVRRPRPGGGRHPADGRRFPGPVQRLVGIARFRHPGDPRRAGVAGGDRQLRSRRARRGAAAPRRVTTSPSAPARSPCSAARAVRSPGSAGRVSQPSDDPGAGQLPEQAVRRGCSASDLRWRPERSLVSADQRNAPS